MIGASKAAVGDEVALTELLVDKIVVAPHPHKIVDVRRHYLIRAIPYQDPQQEAERLKRCTRSGSRSSRECDTLPLERGELTSKTGNAGGSSLAMTRVLQMARTKGPAHR